MDTKCLQHYQLPGKCKFKLQKTIPAYLSQWLKLKDLSTKYYAVKQLIL